MKFSAAAVLATAAGARAVSNATAVTEVVTALTTYCSEATEITHLGVTYTASEPTTLTITNCPCTVTKPIITTSSVICNTPSGISYPTGGNNATNTAVPGATTPAPAPYPIGTGAYTPTTPPASVPTAGAGQTAVFSGAALAGIVGIAAFFL